MQLLRSHDGGEGPQTVCELQVSLFAVSSFTALSHPLYFVVSGLRSTASVSPHIPLTSTNANRLHAVKGVSKAALEGGPQIDLCNPNRTTWLGHPRRSRRKSAGEEGQSLGQRLVSCDDHMFAHRPGSGQPSVGSS